MKATLGIIATLGAIFIFASLSMLLFPIQPPLQSGSTAGKPNVQITLYAGEAASTKFSFGLAPNNLTSPGPTLRFKVGDIVNVTMINVGKISHAFAVTDSHTSNSHLMFGAAVASGSDPLPPGVSGWVVFKVGAAGNYYYICPVPGHAELGMWGNVTVTAG